MKFKKEALECLELSRSHIKELVKSEVDEEKKQSLIIIGIQMQVVSEILENSGGFSSQAYEMWNWIIKQLLKQELLETLYSIT